MSKMVFTVGHSTHSSDYFIALLRKHGVTAVCDVRSMPYSKFNPQFDREVLKSNLSKSGVSYVFLGKELGARSDNPNCYIEGKVQYNYLVEEPLFEQGLRRIKQGMKDYVVAIMCAEKDPLTCHRTILLCRELRSPDVEIGHICADGSIEAHTEAEQRLMRLVGIKPDMLDDEPTCIETAYDRQADKIAYVKTDWLAASGT